MSEQTHSKILLAMGILGLLGTIMQGIAAPVISNLIAGL